MKRLLQLLTAICCYFSFFSKYMFPIFSLLNVCSIQFNIKFHIGNNSALLEQNQDKIIIVKFFAPWCRACKGLEPKFVQISKNPKYDGLPLVFAQLSVANSKEYVKALGVLALPSVHIYAGGEGLVENFPCGPSKVPILKKKIAQVVNQKVDPKTFELKPFCDSTNEAEPCTTRSIATNGSVTKLSVGDVVVKQETMDYLRNDVVFFKDLTDEEFDGLMKRSTYSTFEAGSIILKQGMPGETFYVIDSGTVEILVKGAFEDPTPQWTTPAVPRTSSAFFSQKSIYHQI